MQLLPDDRYNPKASSNEEIVNALYEVFLRDLAHAELIWRPSAVPLSLRREPEVDGRHAIFWHIVSGGSSIETDRTIDPERCKRIGWIRPMIDRFNADYPTEDQLHWWKSPDPRWRDRRYGIATQSFDYVLFVDERPSYALLVTAYYVDRERRRLKFKHEHDEYWKKQEPLA